MSFGTRGVMIAALIGLSGCGGVLGNPVTTSLVVSGPDALDANSRLMVEPFEIAFTRARHARAVSVRVSEAGYPGRYRYRFGEDCNRIALTLYKYETKSNSTVWNVQAPDAPRETCVIEFFGSRGVRGTNHLRIRILR